MGKQQTYAPELPPDVLTVILSRVPAESLGRCKCVCKSWYGLISDAGFVRSHLEHWRSAGHVVISGDRRQRRKLLTLNLEDREAPRPLCIDACLVRALPEPDSVGVLFLDSCDGLLLLRVDDKRPTVEAHHLLVCNPITKWYMLLPPCRPSFRITDVCWFMASDDPAQRYKIIGIKHRTPSSPSGGWCFNLEFRRGESGSWKELPADISWSGYWALLPPYLSVGRKAHWLAVRARGELVLLSLDLSTGRLKLTETLNSPSYTYWDNCFLSDRAMCFGSRIEPSKEFSDVWILEDFDRPVWRKHHVVTNYPQGFASERYKLWKALSYMKEQDELIMGRVGVGTFVYKMSSREWRRIVPPADGHFNSVLAYPHRRHVNSLVGCGGRNGIIC